MTNEQPRILVLDDETEVAEPLQHVLQRAGWDVVAVTDAARALELASAEPFDLVVSDLRAPGLPWLELLRLLRQRRPLLPLIAVTGAGMSEEGVAALKAGAADSLIRPFGAEELVFRVKKALDCERLAEENCQLRQRVDSRIGR